MTTTYRDWASKLVYALQGYRTTVKTSTGFSLFYLIYSMEAVMLIEVEKESLRVVLESQLPKTEWAASRYEQLALLDAKRLNALFDN